MELKPTEEKARKRRLTQTLALAWLDYQADSANLHPELTNSMLGHSVHLLDIEAPYIVPYFPHHDTLAEKGWKKQQWYRGSFGCIVEILVEDVEQTFALKLLQNQESLLTEPGKGKKWGSLVTAELYVMSSIQQLRQRYRVGQLIEVFDIHWNSKGEILGDPNSLPAIGKECLNLVKTSEDDSPIFSMSMEALSMTDKSDYVDNGVMVIRHVGRAMEILFEELELVHCDMHEANIMKSSPSKGSPIYKVIDFGLSQSIFGSSAPRDFVQRHFNGRSDRLDVDVFFGYDWNLGRQGGEEVRGLDSPMQQRADIWSMGMILLDKFYRDDIDRILIRDRLQHLADLFEISLSSCTEEEQRRWRLTLKSLAPIRRNEYLKAMLRMLIVVSAVLIPGVSSHKNFTEWINTLNPSRQMAKVGAVDTYFLRLKNNLVKYPSHASLLEEVYRYVKEKKEKPSEEMLSFLWFCLNPLPVGRFGKWSFLLRHRMLSQPPSR